jgi:hypothetical protein
VIVIGKDVMNRKVSVSGWQLIGSILIFGVVIYELITGEIIKNGIKGIMVNRVNQPIEFWVIVGIKVTAASAFAHTGIVGIIEESKSK